MSHTSNPPAKGSAVRPAGGLPFPVPRFMLQPVLHMVVHRVARENPDMFGRLGPWRSSQFLIDPVELPFALLLRPDPDRLMLRAVSRRAPGEHVARISGRFFDLLQLVDAGADGDALFFARGLEVTGNTEAVVCLRNALDDVEGSIAESVADMFGPPGRMALAVLRRAGERRQTSSGG